MATSKSVSGLISELNQGRKKLEETIPEVMERFGALREAVYAKGKLTAKDKSLIALAIAVAKQCDYCVAGHLLQAVEAGADDQEIMEAVGVAIVMSGGPGVAYAGLVKRGLEELRGKR